MDEAKAMAVAGEQLGKAVGTGVRTAREAATQAGKAGALASKQAATRAQRELRDRGISTDDLHERLIEQTAYLAGQNLTQKRKQARQYLAKNTRTARRDLAAKIDPDAYRPRRKWPWLLLLAAAVLGVAITVILSRRPEEIPVAEPPHHEQGSPD